MPDPRALSIKKKGKLQLEINKKCAKKFMVTTAEGILIRRKEEPSSADFSKYARHS